MRKGLKIDIFPSGIEYRFRGIHYVKFPIPDNDYGQPELGFDFLLPLWSKTKSVETDQSVIFNRLQILKFNDAK